MRLKNKVALLAGAGTGMGRGTALLFSQEGAKLAVNARSRDSLSETLALADRKGHTARGFIGDVSLRSEAERIVEDVVSHYGRLDILYCGAGGNFEPSRSFEEVKESYWRETIINTMDSIYNLSHAANQIMREQGGGVIISIVASSSVMQEGNPAYGAAKGGVISLCQNLARELYADNIRVNTIAAGLFRGTYEWCSEIKINPAPPTLSRTGHPQDIAYAALYLASDEAAWVTGQTLTVDGGVDVGTRHLWEFER